MASTPIHDTGPVDRVPTVIEETGLMMPIRLDTGTLMMGPETTLGSSPGVHVAYL